MVHGLLSLGLAKGHSKGILPHRGLDQSYPLFFYLLLMCVPKILLNKSVFNLIWNVCSMIGFIHDHWLVVNSPLLMILWLVLKRSRGTYGQESPLDVQWCSGWSRLCRRSYCNVLKGRYYSIIISLHLQYVISLTPYLKSHITCVYMYICI